MYIVGVDVAKRSHEATVIDSSGSTIKKAFNFRNDADGFQKLITPQAFFAWGILTAAIRRLFLGYNCNASV